MAASAVTRVWLAAILLLSPCAAMAQTSADDTTPAATTSGSEGLKQAARTGLGGPQSVSGQLAEDEVQRRDVSRRPGWDAFFQTAEDALTRLNKTTGLKLGFDYQAVWLGASHSLTTHKKGSAGHARMLGKWALVGRGTDNQGSLSFILEQRHELWNEQTPAQLGGDLGYLGIVGTAFGDSGAHLTTGFWEQALFGGRAGFVAGRIDPTDYTDILGYANQRTTFLNLTSLINPTIGAPDPGFGAGAGAMITDNIYALGVISDANGSLQDVEWFPGGSEFFKYGEIGLTPAKDERYTTNIHVGFWEVDARKDAGIPQAHGIVASANITLRENFMPFVRAGWSDGAAPLYKRHVSGGFIYLFQPFRDLVGFSVAHDTPATIGLKDQTTLEAFYRYQFSGNIAITANAQLLINPALNPTQDRISVFGVRTRFNM